MDYNIIKMLQGVRLDNAHFKLNKMKPQIKLAIVLLIVMYLVGLIQDIHSL